MTRETETERLTLEVPVDAEVLWQDPEIRRDLLGTVSPLDEGVETITVADSAGDSISIGSEHRGYFDVPRLLPDEARNQERCYLNVVAPAFERRHAWRMKEEKRSSDWYYIMDTQFLNGVDDGSLRFGKFDVLECTVETTRTTSPDGDVSIRREILKVHHHHIQGQMPS